MKVLRRALSCAVALAALLTGFLAPAAASPVTHTFTGKVTEASSAGLPLEQVFSVGQAVTGFLTLDRSTMDQGYSIGTQAAIWGDYYAQVPASCSGCQLIADPHQVQAGATSASAAIAVGGGAYSDTAAVSLGRNVPVSAAGTNFFGVFAESVEPDDVYRFLEIGIADDLGAATQIFGDPNGGVSLDQPINWGASGATTYFALQYFAGPGAGYQVFGTIDTLSISSSGSVQAVPEPGVLPLVVLALAGALCMTLCKARRT